MYIFSLCRVRLQWFTFVFVFVISLVLSVTVITYVYSAEWNFSFSHSYVFHRWCVLLLFWFFSSKCNRFVLLLLDDAHSFTFHSFCFHFHFRDLYKLCLLNTLVRIISSNQIKWKISHTFVSNNDLITILVSFILVQPHFLSFNYWIDRMPKSLWISRNWTEIAGAYVWVWVNVQRHGSLSYI